MKNCRMGRGEPGDGYGNHHCFRAGAARPASCFTKEEAEGREVRELLKVLQNSPLQVPCPVPFPLYRVELV